MRWRVRHDRPSSPTGEPTFRSFMLRLVAVLRCAETALKTSNRKDARAVIHPGDRRWLRPPGFPLRQAEMQICGEIPVDNMLRAIYSVLTIAEHFRSTLCDQLTS
jgi:hypothetical protein